MNPSPYKSPLHTAYELALAFLENLDNAPAGSTSSFEELYALWNDKLPAEGSDPAKIISDLYHAAIPGLNLNQSGRFFAWVIGGSHPASLAADWLTSAWDQNAGMFTVAPSATIAEGIAGTWLKQILHLPMHASFAFVTGCQMAHVTCLSVARNQLLHQAGWDIETQGFYGAPEIRIICSDQRHVTINRALRLLGFGTSRMIHIPTDASGRMDAELFEKEFEKDLTIPTIVLLQCGDVNTGVSDDFKNIIPIARRGNSWIHIDGAFGLWASASPAYAHLNEDVHLADSWATDGHKWLNVPFDCGYAFTAHPEAHRRTMGQPASYLTHDDQARDPLDYNPEFSRRARGFATYAAIRELGVSGIATLIQRCCIHAASIIEQIGQLPQTEVVVAPVINQGLVRFLKPNATDEKEHDAFTEHVIREINKTGEAFFQPTTYKGKRCMRVSVSGWATNEEDVRRVVDTVKLVLSKTVLKD